MIAQQPVSRLTLPDLPRRLITSAVELQTWCAAAGTRPPRMSPVASVPTTARISDRLGADPAPDRSSPPRGGSRRAGRPDWDGRLDQEVRAALRLLDLPDLMVDLDLVRPIRRGVLHLRSWHRIGAELAVGLSTIDGDHFELMWCAPHRWAAELNRSIDLSSEPDRGGRSTSDEPTPSWPAYLEVPLEAVVTATATATRRADLRAEALSRWGGRIREYDDQGERIPVDPARVLEWIARPVSRLQVAVMVPRPDTPVGLITWVADGPGWWELAPLTREGHRLVAFTPVAPSSLAPRVGRFLPRLVGKAAA